MKKICCILGMAFLLVVRAELLENVRNNLEGLRSSARISSDSYFAMREEWEEMNIETNVCYQLLENSLSNHWESVLERVDEVSSNREDRLILLATGSCCGQTNFLARMNFVTDLVLAGRLSLVELKFFETQCMLKDSWGASVLVREYYRPNVSNLILKIERAGGYPNGVTNIFNGADKELYEDAVFDGLIR